MLLHFRIQITGISKPPVWRDVNVPADFTFARLHRVIQEAFGWTDSHLHQFSESGYRSATVIGPTEFLEEEDLQDSQLVKLSVIFKAEGQKYTYIYDFGDSWLHQIILKKITNKAAKHADLIAGKGACPPEDCGGPSGYEQLKQTMRNSKDPEYAELKEWLGVEADESWDPAAFNLEEARDVVRAV